MVDNLQSLRSARTNMEEFFEVKKFQTAEVRAFYWVHTCEMSLDSLETLYALKRNSNCLVNEKSTAKFQGYTDLQSPRETPGPEVGQLGQEQIVAKVC